MRKIGWVILVLGILLLLGGVFLAFTLDFGDKAVPAVLFASILANSAGITLLHMGKHDSKGKR